MVYLILNLQHIDFCALGPKCTANRPVSHVCHQDKQPNSYRYRRLRKLEVSVVYRSAMYEQSVLKRW